MRIHATLAAAQTHIDEFLDELAALVNLDSGSYYAEGVANVAAYLAPRFVALGCVVEVRPGHSMGPTLIARKTGSGRGRVLLIGHMDTVFPRGEPDRRPFALREGRAYGPGVFDMKSGLLVSMYALRLLHEAGEQPYGDLTVLCNGDEEVGSPESTPIVEELARHADAALVLEPTARMNRVTVARKGVGTYHVEVAGVAAHAGVEPRNGRNAILEMAHLIIALHAINGTIDGVTLNVGVISGGERPNIVPERATIQIDVRATSLPAVEAVEAAMLRVVATAHVPDTTARLTGQMHHLPFQQSEASARLFSLANGVAKDLGFELRGEPTGGASDGNTTAGMGLATLDGLGLIGALAHNPGEYIMTDSIAPRVALLAGILRALSAHPLAG